MRRTDSRLAVALLLLEEEEEEENMARTSADAADDAVKGLRGATNASVWNTADPRATHAASVTFADTAAIYKRVK